MVSFWRNRQPRFQVKFDPGVFRVWDETTKVHVQCLTLTCYKTPREDGSKEFTAKTVVLTGVHRGPHQAFYTGVKFLVLAQHPVCYFNTLGCYFNTLWCYVDTLGCSVNT